MNYTCKHCRTINSIPDDRSGEQFACNNCGAKIPPLPIDDGSTSVAVGLIGGAALGASIAGPPGAIIGGIVGAMVGTQSKGLG